MGLQSPLLLLLIFTMAGYSLGQCPTKPPKGSHSSHSDQPTKDCECPESLKCQYASSTDMPTSAASSTDNPSSTTAASGGGGPPPSAEPCPCVFINELVNMKYLYLTPSQQVIFEFCLVDIRAVLIDVTLTIYERVSKIGHLLHKHFKANQDIKAVLKYKKVAGMFRIFQFISTGIQFDYAKTDSLMAIQDSTGANNLTIAIRQGTAGDLCGTGSSVKINAHCDKGDKVLKKTIAGYKDNKGRKMGHFKQTTEKNLFFLNPSLETCVRNVQIKGFGSLDQFLTMAGMFDTISSFGFSIVIGAPSQCLLIQQLQAYLNSNSTVNSTAPAVLIEANGYVQDLIAYFNQVTDVVLRLKFIVSQASTKNETCRTLLYGAPITDDYDFADCHAASIFSAQNNVNATAGPASEQTFETVIIDPAYDISDFEECFYTFYNSINKTMQLYVNTYKNSINNCIRSLYPGDYPSKYNCAIYQIQRMVGSQVSSLAPLKALLLAVEFAGVLVVQSATSIVFGTFRSLCGCGN